MRDHKYYHEDQGPHRSHEKHFICDYTNMLVKRENVKNLYLSIVSLFNWSFRPTRECFTHMEASP